MSEERHTVLVHNNQVQEYLDRGYRLEEQSAADYMRDSPVVWGAMGDALFADQRVMSIGAIEKAKLDTAKQRFGLRATEATWVANRLAILKYDVLDEVDCKTLVAPSDADGGPEELFTGELYDSPRECVAGNRPHLLREVEKLRDAANLIEDFLRKHEAL